MKKKNSNICRLFLTLLGLLMAIQICFGFAWMVVNLANIPIFGDSTEYFNLSQTLMSIVRFCIHYSSGSL